MFAHKASIRLMAPFMAQRRGETVGDSPVQRSPRIGPWLGGFIRQTKAGPVYVIERMVGGRAYKVSTRKRTELAALKQLALFELDPEGYDPLGSPDDAVRMTAELIDEHERWQLETKRNTKAHVESCAAYLERWLVDLHGRDLRELRAVELREMLQARGARRYRAIALKGFFRWLRVEKGLLRHAEDASLDLAVPGFVPAQVRRKRAVPHADVEKALAYLRGPVADVVRLMAGTGLHLSEVSRFAAGGELFAPSPEQAAAGVRVVLAVKHKGGQLHTVKLLDAAVVEAARRLRASERLPTRSAMRLDLHAACTAADVPRFNLGVLRHSVATWLVEAGHPIAWVAEFLGHRSPRTTALFYADMGAASKPLAVPPLRPSLQVA
jgi:integrase